MRTPMEEDLRIRTSKYMSYLLRHNPENLKMNRHGFVDINELLKKLRKRFPVDKELILNIAGDSERKRFEIVGGEIRALYGHTIPVELEFEEADDIAVLYHGTTPEVASEILDVGLKSMKRQWVHLSPTIELAIEVGMRRTRNPVVLEVNADAARRDGLRFYKATDKVYVCKAVPPSYLKKAMSTNHPPKHAS
jgi:putative RNA 2'-phosphotransferase